jgi:hypothetical protein
MESVADEVDRGELGVGHLDRFGVLRDPQPSPPAESHNVSSEATTATARGSEEDPWPWPVRAIERHLGALPQ